MNSLQISPILSYLFYSLHYTLFLPLNLYETQGAIFLKKFFISAILQVSFLSCFLSIRYFISFTKLGSSGFYFKVNFKLSPFFLNLSTTVTLQSSILFSLVFHGLLVYLFSKLVATPRSLIGLRLLVLELASPLIAGCLNASQGLGKPVCLFF